MNKTSFIISILLIISLSFNVHQCNRKRDKEYVNVEKEVTVEKTDTIIDYIYKTDTIYNTKKDTEYKYITKNDTVYIENKPEIYKDSTDNYDITIQSVKMDWYKLNIHKRDSIQYENKIIRETIVKKEKQNPFGVSLFLGPGYDLYNKQMGVSVGIGLTFRIK